MTMEKLKRALRAVLPRVETDRRSDQEFLPAALEILERPASPIGSGLILFICLFAFTAVVWAWISSTDIVATARGKIQPVGRVRTVQPLEPGKIRHIHVENGARVKEGDVLVELETEDAQSDVAALSLALASAQAEVARRTAVIAAARDDDAPLVYAWPDDIAETTRARQAAAGEADLANLRDQIASLRAQRAQKEAERDKTRDMIAAQEELVVTLTERYAMRDELVARASGARSSVIDALESLNTQKVALQTYRGQNAEAQRAADALSADMSRARAAFVADNSARRADAERQTDDLAARLIKAKARLERTVLRSPADGIVQGSIATSVGQVLNSGQETMRIVPAAAALEIEAYFENKDVGFLDVGQAASVKIDAFPFTRYGVVAARVMRVAADAIPDPDARQAEADPTKSAPLAGVAGGQRVQSLVFPVLLRADAVTIQADGRAVPLSPGMAVTVEIKTGSRSILDYFLSPLRETTSESMRER